MRFPAPLSNVVPAHPLPEGHPDYKLITDLSDEIEKLSKGWPRFVSEVPKRLRLALDEVIDTPRTGRFVLGQTEKTEKTYIGTKVEILIRDFLGVPKGLLDLNVNGVDVDVKNTVGSGWMIPREAVGKLCILVRENEQSACCSVGLIVCRPSYLTSGKNQDGKASISAAGQSNIHWLLKNQAYPKNFWETVPEEVRRDIIAPRGGNHRLYKLFKNFLGQPIARQTIEAIGQKDFMRRLRKNGGLRDLLEPESIVLLSGTYDKQLAGVFGFGTLGKDEFIACAVKTEAQLKAVMGTRKHLGITKLAQ